MEPGTEPHDWMWLGTAEMVLAGWNAGEFEKKSLGNNKYVLDPDAAYEYVITCAPSRLNIRVRVRVS